MAKRLVDKVIRQGIRPVVEKIIELGSRGGKPTFYDLSSFPWVVVLEAGWRAIRAELETQLVHREKIPNFQDLSADQEALTEGEQWKTFFLYGYGHKIEANCAQCPDTTRLLQAIPGMKTAMFSILAPGKHIPAHRGVYNGVLRYHLGLIIPGPSASCRIRVGSDVCTWEEGKSLIFDDSHPHEAWNDSDRYRVVLFVDFLRPLRFPIALLNRFIVWRISRSHFLTQGLQRMQQAGAGSTPSASRNGAALGRSR